MLSRNHSAAISHARRQREGGYLLLAVMLLMAMMIIAATIAAPKFVQQMKRDREEEMIHRGTEYARAIKKFYKKNGRYPSTLDDLDKGQVRYLRKRYKDPLTKDGKWKMLNYGDIQSLLNANAPGTPAAALGAQGGALTPGGAISPAPGGAFGGSSFSAQPAQQQFQQNPGLVSGFNSNSDQGNSEGAPGANFGGSATGSDQGFSSSNNQGGSGNGNQGFGNNVSPNGATGLTSGNTQVFGGGAIVGVASLSKDPTIRIYNKKKKYNEWQFIYNPATDQPNVLLRGPYQPVTIGGAQVGTPAGQLNGQQNSPFGQSNGLGQQNNGFGQQNSNGFGQQNNPQQLQPGGSFPPDQNQK